MDLASLHATVTIKKHLHELISKSPDFLHKILAASDSIPLLYKNSLLQLFGASSAADRLLQVHMHDIWTKKIHKTHYTYYTNTHRNHCFLTFSTRYIDQMPCWGSLTFINVHTLPWPLLRLAAEFQGFIFFPPSKHLPWHWWRFQLQNLRC